jgi:isoleucyl-tRNA synthetase
MVNQEPKPPLRQAPENIDFSKAEEETLKLWKKLDAFHTQNKLREGKPKWSFYDGPPFATGMPHYGHLLASTIKDTVCRDAVMNDYYVERRWGWDCHGLPIEYEIDKKFGISGPAAVEKMGIANYNKACREIVMTYADCWEDTITRLGRWIDFENDYKTMYPYYMESVWWVFKQIFDKGLVYKGFKVMPYSTKCCTPLSNFEAGQNYQDVTDPAVVVSFPLVEDPEVSLVAWTTTPWTLPMNLATCVHPDLEYIKLKEKSTGKKIHHDEGQNLRNVQIRRRIRYPRNLPW